MAMKYLELLAKLTLNILLFVRELTGYMRKSLVRKLMFFYCVIVLIPFMLLGYYIYNQSESYLKDKFSKISENFADNSISRVNVKIKECENVLTMIKTDKMIGNLLEPNYYSKVEVLDILNNYSNNLPKQINELNDSVINVHVYMMKNQLPDLTRFFYDKKRVENELWFKRALEQLTHDNNILWITTIDNKPVYFGERYYKGTIISGLTKLWNRKFNIVTGIVEVQIKQNELFNMLTNWSSKKDVPEVLVLDENGYVAHSTLKGGHDWLEPALKSSPSDIIEAFYSANDRSEYYAVSRTLDKLRCSVFFFFPMSDLKNQNNIYRNLIIALGLIFTTALAVIYNFVAQKVFKGFKEVVSAVNRIQDGDLDIHIEIRGTDDVWGLARNINIMTNRIKQLIEKNIQSQVAQKDAQIMALQAQINPHYLYNTLEVIRMMAEAEGKYDISDTLHSLGSTMRYGISTKSTQMISLMDEIKYIQHYFRIQKLYLRDKVEFNLSVAEELKKEAARCQIMKFLIQPIVENAIIHGLKNVPVKGAVRVDIINIEGVLNIKVMNNGNIIPRDKLLMLKKGLEQQEGYILPDSKSIGIRNVNERIKLFYGEQYGLDIESSEECGTVVLIRIPYMCEEK
jgi:two-component system sensor histidine kinase YesM